MEDYLTTNTCPTCKSFAFKEAKESHFSSEKGVVVKVVRDVETVKAPKGESDKPPSATGFRLVDREESASDHAYCSVRA